MNEITLLREAGPEAPPLRPAALQVARAALLAEIASTTTGWHTRSRVRLSRKVTVRLALAATAVTAAACVAAAVSTAPATPATPATRVDLVAFTPPTFPLALDPAPAGLTAHFSADPGAVLHAGYSGTGGDDRISITVTPDKPELQKPSDEKGVTVAGRDGELVTEHVTYATDRGSEVRSQAALRLEWSDGQWVELTGGGRYDDRDRLLAVARTLVAKPQPVPLQVHLAPEGWSVQAYKDDRVLTLVNDSYERQSVNVFLTEQPIPADQLLHALEGPPVGPVIDVTINGRPAQLVRLAARDAADNGWYLQAQFAGGQAFVVQAPAAFTQQQVLAFAAQVTYTP
jgi:hypothetical protein